MGRASRLETYKSTLLTNCTTEQQENESGVSLFSVTNTHAGLASTLKAITKAIKRFEAGLAYSECPSELCDGEELDLTTWSLIITDNTLARIAQYSQHRLQTAARLEQQQLEHRQMVNGSFRGLPNSTAMADLKELALLGSKGLISLKAGGATQVTDRGLNELSKGAPNLEVLILHSALQVGDAGVRELAIVCTRLEELDLSGCMGLEGPGLAALGDCCHKLTSIKLAGCRNVQPWALVHLFKGCPKLQILDLSYCPRLTDLELKSLAEYCTNLRSVILKDCPQVSDVGVLSISHGCTKLDTLDLSRSEMPFRITDVSLLALGERCFVLGTLKLSGCDAITDVGLTWLSKGCHALHHLEIAQCPKVGNAGVGAICDGCPDIKFLDITGDKKIGDTALRYIGDRSRKLHTLKARGLFLISDGKKREFGLEGVQALAQGCPELAELDLSGAFQVSTNALRSLHQLRLLQSLNLSNCTKITTKGLSAALSTCTLMASLNLSGCGDAVNNKALQIIGNMCHRLEKIFLSGCEAFGDAGLRALFKDNTHVETLDFSGCIGVGDTAMLILGEANFNPGLRTVHLTNCSALTDTGLSWLCDGCPTIHLLSLKGTKVHLTALQSVRDLFIYSEIRKNSSFFGMWPFRRVKDRMEIDDYGSRVQVATKIQALFRARKTRRETEKIRRIYYSYYLNRQLNALWRKKKGGDFLAKLRAEKARADAAATRIQGLYKMKKARERLKHLKHVKYMRRANLAARDIQRCYRGLLARRRTAARREQIRQLQLLRIRCAQNIQRVTRGMFGRKRFQKRRASNAACQQRRVIAAIMMQNVMRGRHARKKVAALQLVARKRILLETSAVVTMQRLARRFKARKEFLHRQKVAFELNQASAKIQKIWRGIRARLHFQELMLIHQELREEKASITIQGVWRAGLARAKARRMWDVKRLLDQKRNLAARKIQHAFRGLLGKRKGQRLRQLRLDEIKRMKMLEINAAITIQSGWRGKKGRDIYRAKRLAHMQRWKKLWDEERQRAFYYNQISGEIRWRAPQDILELMEKPGCSNCEAFEAYLECQDCREYYCSVCWESVHYGGKRKMHKFRVMYDYYHKRIDYGDGEFPSRWPCEIEQDDMDGWHLRVSPYREPVEISGAWEAYYDEQSGRYFYFNVQSKQSSYEMPAVFQNSKVDLQTGSNNTQPESGQNQSIFATDPNTSDWIKCFDDQYQVDYFYNQRTGESTYTQPEF